MKAYTLFVTAIAITCCSCAGWQRVGNMTMLSTRNVDSSKPYQLVMRGVTGEAKMRQDDAMQTAVDKAVAQHSGGEYMMNVAVYVKENGKAVRVTGDVWGLPVAGGTASPTVTGSVEMKVGDAVFFKHQGKHRRAVIIGIRNDAAIVEYDGRTREVKLAELTAAP